jgi:hypothetical protein
MQAIEKFKQTGNYGTEAQSDVIKAFLNFRSVIVAI